MNPTQELWQDVYPYIQNGTVETREQAYILFSKVLKIAKLSVREEYLKEFCLKTLAEGSFSLCLDGEKPIPYRFDTIIELLKSGQDAFKIELLEVDPENTDLTTIAEAIHTIAASSIGSSPGAAIFQSIISLPSTLCLLAKEKDTFIACTYGSYLSVGATKFFHLNFLGRLIEYPSIHILETLQGEIKRVQTRFPDTHYLTLCVSTSNDHMLPIYKNHGFEEIEYIEKGFQDKPTYFYAKKLDPNTHVRAPTYLEYKAASDEQRKNRK